MESRFVDSVEVDPSNTGKVTYSTELIAGGFDKVVVSAVLGENDRESSFTLQGVDFVTAPSAIAVASGELDVASGADGYAEAFAVANVQFAMEQMFSPQPDGTYSLSILDGNNEPKSATVTVMIDDMGNSRLTATVGGKELFAATLEKDGDGWSWKMEQYQEFKVVGADGSSTTFELQFITEDGDGDTMVQSAVIALEFVTDPVITIADEDATLTTDESYISSADGQPAGSGEPADSDGVTAEDSGSFSVNLNGMAYTLVIEGRNDNSLTLHFDREGNLVSEEGEPIALDSAVVSSTYGHLTITSAHAKDGTLTVTYTYTQDNAFTHPKDGNAFDAKADNADGFTVTVTDTAGNSTASTISVTIEDDGPVITAENPDSVHAAHTHEGIVEGTFTVNHGADGAESTTFSYTDAQGVPHELYEVSGKYVYTEDDYTVTVVPGATDASGNTQYEYKVEYDSTTVGEGFGGKLSVSATDGDFDTAVKDIVITVSNDAPVATDDSFTIYKEVEGTSTVSASASATLPGSMITVGGHSELNESDVHWVNDNAHDGYVTISENAGSNDLFGNVFTDLGNNKLTMDQLAGAANIYVYDGGDLQKAVEYADQNDLLLYIKGDLNTSDLNGQPLSCVTIVTGDLTVDSNASINSFLYVAGDATIGKGWSEVQLTVSGGLAVAGDLEVNTGWPWSDVSVEVEHTANVFTPSNVIISKEVESTDQPEAQLTISFDELLNNDSDDDSTDPANDGMEISSIKINGTDYTTNVDCSDIRYSETTTISINWEKETITVTNTGENSESIGFDYTVQDFHGATDTASVTVNVSANTGAGSMGDDLIQGATNTFSTGSNYNIAIALDTSSSISNNDIDTAQEAISNMLKGMRDQLATAGDNHQVNVMYIDFDTVVRSSTEITITKNTTDDEIEYFIENNSFTTGGGTNYDAAFYAMSQWFNEVSNENAINKSYFITDGNPSFYYQDTVSWGRNNNYHEVTIPKGSTDGTVVYDQNGRKYTLELTSEGWLRIEGVNSINSVLNGTGQGGDISFNDNADSYNALKEHCESIHVIGIDKNGSSLDSDELNLYDSDGAAQIISSPDELKQALDVENHNAPKADTIFSSAGDDVVFGDAARMNLHGKEVTLAAYVAAMIGTVPSTKEVLDYVHDHAEEINANLVVNTDDKNPDQPDALLGGTGDDVLFGQGGDDLLIGDGSDAASGSGAQDTLDMLIAKYELQPLEDNTSVTTQQIVDAIHGNSDNLSNWLEGLENGGGAGTDKADGNDQLFGGTGDDVLLGMGGDDKLFGGAGDDILVGGSGNDYLDGGEGKDTMYAGSGNDIIVYDKGDYLVDGGDGIDVMVHNGQLSLDDLLNGDGADNGPIVRDVEVLITGDDALSLTSMAKLAEYGITIDKNDAGQDTLTLSADWKPAEGDDGSYTYQGSNDVDLTLQTNIQPPAGTEVDAAVQQQVLILQHSNG